MRLTLLLVPLITALALAVSWFLIPGASEQALMRLQSGDIEQSREILQRRVAAGDLSVGVISPLVQIQILEGDVDQAVSTIRAYVRAHPDEPSGLDRLGDLLRQANQWRAYADNRRDLYLLTGNRETLQDYSGLVLLQDRREDRIWALTELDRINAAEPDEILELVQRRAASGDVGFGRQRLQRLITGAAEPADDLILTTYARLAAAQNADADLLATSVHWLMLNPKADDLISYLAYLSEIRQTQLAMQLITTVNDRADIQEALADLEVQFRAPEAAMRRLESLPALSDSGLRQLFDLAIEAGQSERAAAAWRRMKQPDPELTLNLLETAQAAGQGALVAEISGRLSEAELGTRPLLAARLSVASSNRDQAAKWLTQAQAGAVLTLDERITAAQLYLQIGQEEPAFTLLQSIRDDPGTPVENLADLGDMYFRLGRFRVGTAAMADLREKRPHRLLDAAWARLAARAGETAAVRTWLSEARPDDPALLEDLYFIGGDEKDDALALTAAKRLLELKPDATNFARVGGTMLNMGRGREALALLAGAPGPFQAELADLRFRAELAAGDPRKLAAAIVARLSEKPHDLTTRNELFGILLDPKVPPPADPGSIIRLLRGDLALADLPADARDLRLALLERLNPAETLPYRRQAAARDPGGATDALIDLLVRLKRRDELLEVMPAAIRRAPDRKSAEQRLYILIDVGGPGPALPFLERAAAEWGGDWSGAYEDALDKLGRRDQLLALLKQRAGDVNRSKSERRDVAFRLLDLRERAAAEATFRDLAQSEPPEGENTQQLLYLWGPRPGPAALDWLVQRARTAAPAQQTGWLTLLRDRGGDARLRQLLTADETALLDDPARLGLLLELLPANRLEPEGTDWILRAGQRSSGSAPKTEALLDLAEAQGLTRARDTLSRQLLLLAPESREARRRRAQIAFQAGRRTEAQQLYAGLLAEGPGDWESHFNYGELLQGRQQRREARIHFETSLGIIERQRRPNPAAQRTRAWLLARLDRKNEALAAIDSLLKARPGDADLRLDLAGLALELGAPDRAGQILNQ